MTSDRDDELMTQELLLEMLGEDAFFALVEARGGTRLYVPEDPNRSELTQIIGGQAAYRLARSHGRCYIKVPVARRFRALRLIGQGSTNREVALHLRMSESGVEKLLRDARRQKAVRRPKKPKKVDPRQMDLF